MPIKVWNFLGMDANFGSDWKNSEIRSLRRNTSSGAYIQIKLKILGSYILNFDHQVLKSFGLFVLTFTSLLTAFALSFSILMPQVCSFRHLLIFVLNEYVHK